jgi:hypothetical protein
VHSTPFDRWSALVDGGLDERVPDLKRATADGNDAGQLRRRQRLFGDSKRFPGTQDRRQPPAAVCSDDQQKALRGHRQPADALEEESLNVYC